MNQHLIESEEVRDVIVVVSDSPVFTKIVGRMVGESGFTAMPMGATEFAWASVQPLRPCLVICDCEAPAADVEHVFQEAAAARVPLLLSQMGPKPHIAQALRKADRVAWFSFPIAREAFSATIHTVLQTSPIPYRVTATVAGATIDAGIRVRDLLGSSSGEIS